MHLYFKLVTCLVKFNLNVHENMLESKLREDEVTRGQSLAFHAFIMVGVKW